MIEKAGVQFKTKQLLRSTQPFSTLKIFFFWFQKRQQQHKCHNVCLNQPLLCKGLGPVLGRSLLLCLLVQLHVRHQDVLLNLLRLAGVGAAVAGPFIGPPGPDRSPTVQVDHADYQHHQHQARHHDNNQSGQVVATLH